MATERKNSVFIASSLDGYIADKDGGLDWLHAIPNPEQKDMGYLEFTVGIDALIMGRVTFDTVCSIDIDWPYTKPVYVLSNSLKAIPEKYVQHAQLVQGTLSEVLDKVHNNGHDKLYIDGGGTIRSFLKEDLIDEMIITTIPVLLGGGAPLFGDLDKHLDFRCVSSEIHLDSVVQSRFVRVR